MQLYNVLQAALITSAIAARREPRQIVVTVTAVIPPTPQTAPSPMPLSSAPVPWEQPQPADSSSSTSGALSLPPGISTSSTTTLPTTTNSPGSSQCDKGYTYCGYTLTGNDHNFPPEEITKSYCNGLPAFCTDNKFKTNVAEAVFVCMSEQPPTIQLLCACGDTCLNNATSNYIAHCDKACVNK